MKLFLRLFGIWLLLGCAQHAWSQVAGPKIDRVDIKFVGPASVSEPFIRSNIHAKAGDIYPPNLTRRTTSIRFTARSSFTTSAFPWTRPTTAA